MNLTPSESHEDASIHTQSYMWLWVARHLDWLEEAEEESTFSPLLPPSDWMLNLWARELIEKIPVDSDVDRGKVFRACKVFFTWCSMYLTSWQMLVDYRLTFDACFPLKGDIETNLRDSQFIAWFIHENLHTFLALRQFYTNDR